MRNKLFLIIFAIALSLVLIELVLRFCGVGYNVFFKPLQKSISVTDYRIFCLGESTTWGVGTEYPPREGYPIQLENMLTKRFPDKKIHCFFDQTIGQNTSEIMLKLPNYIKKYRPNLVILMVGANNWWNLDQSNILLFNNNKYISDISLKVYIFLDRLRLWKLFKWLRLSLNLYKGQWDRSYIEGDKPLDMEIKEWTEAVPEIFCRLTEYDISEMIKICKINNVKTLICNYPMGGWSLMKHDLGLDVIQREVASKLNVPFVDNYTFFKRLPNLEDYLCRDRWHPNGKGYKLLAQNIYNCILENELIK